MSTVAPEEAIALVDFFDDDGQCRLVEADDGWMGFERDEKGYLFVDTREGAVAWLRCVRVGSRAVRETIKRSVSDDGQPAFRRGGDA